MIQKTEFGFTGSITDLPAWGTNPEMGFTAALVAINQMKTNSWCKGMALPDGSFSGCSCDCPACEEAAKKLAKLEPYLTVSGMALAGLMYTAYCEAVGGVAYDGKPLPAWPEFSTDPTKKKQTLGWLAAANAVRPKQPRALTPQEKAKGRSEGYWEMSAEDQWAEDKRLGILDWDGK